MHAVAAAMALAAEAAELTLADVQHLAAIHAEALAEARPRAACSRSCSADARRALADARLLLAADAKSAAATADADAKH